MKNGYKENMYSAYIHAPQLIIQHMYAFKIEGNWLYILPVNLQRIQCEERERKEKKANIVLRN